MKIDKTILDEANLAKLEALGNKKVLEIVEKYAELCQPSKVTVLTDSLEDRNYVKQLALKNKEEIVLGMKGHTVHFDGYGDQGRDKKNTRILLPKGRKISKGIETVEREEGLKEVFSLLEGIMKGKEMLVCFFCLGPLNSPFSILALQLTDSAYVVHSESILYRQGYEAFKNNPPWFFHFVHSSGELDERSNSKNIDKRRVYMDLEEERVFTINNQYAGNSVGLKKLALRLAISKANKEDWLCEHMLVMGIKPLGKERISYFTGAFPSACGKTSTAMVPGQTIVGDDIAYLKIGEGGRAYAANVEQGVFGIIEDVNLEDDALIFKALSTPREVIFSNILVKEGKPYWLGMGEELPIEGINYSGAWWKSKKDPEGKEIPPNHKNARYTLSLKELENADSNLDGPRGVQISGMIYGGRDSDTNPPVVESFDWAHGVFIGSCLESETSFATLSKMGVREHNPMANLDFLTVPLGVYVENHLKFGSALSVQPKIFSTNYFLKEEGEYLNEKVDKKIWLLWMEGRAHEEYSARETPIGFIPLFSDLKKLFRQVFGREYTGEAYNKQFSIRIGRSLERLDRMEKVYQEEEGMPPEFHKQLEQQRKRLLEAKEKFGKEVVEPGEFEEVR